MTNIPTYFRHWCHRPAKWYEFWYPQSSFIGGLIWGSIAGMIIGTIILYLRGTL